MARLVISLCTASVRPKNILKIDPLDRDEYADTSSWRESLFHSSGDGKRGGGVSCISAPWFTDTPAVPSRRARSVVEGSLAGSVERLKHGQHSPDHHISWCAQHLLTGLSMVPNTLESARQRRGTLSDGPPCPARLFRFLGRTLFLSPEKA